MLLLVKGSDPFDPVRADQERPCLVEVPALHRQEPAPEPTIGAEDVRDGIGTELGRAVPKQDRRLSATGPADLPRIEALAGPTGDLVLLVVPAGDVLAATAAPDVQMPPILGYGCGEKPTSRSKTVFNLQI